MSDALRDRLQAAVGDCYVLDRDLSTGGTSRVYTATDTRLGRAVVIKVLAPELGVDGVDGVDERFRREIVVTAQLQHPNIMPVFAAGEAGGFLYFTMPFIEGETLRARLARSPRPSIDEVVHVLRSVAMALAYAHARGVVHRDVKPDNVVLEARTDRVLVADFGIARLVHADTHVTQDGAAVGTPLYMSPEQIDSGHVDGRSDVYSLALVAWEMLSGCQPWAGATLCTVLYNQKYEALPALTTMRRDVPPGLSDGIDRALAKDPARRPSAAALLDALDRLPSGATTPLRRRMRARQARPLLAAACALFMLPTATPNRSPRTLQPVVVSRPLEPVVVSRAAVSHGDVSPVLHAASHVAPHRRTARVQHGPPPPGVPPIVRPTHADSLDRCTWASPDDQQACFAARVADGDAALDAVFADLIDGLRRRAGTATDPGSVRYLRDGEEAWQAMRDRVCRRRAGPETAALWAETRAACMSDMARRRTETLSRIRAAVPAGPMVLRSPVE